MSDELLLKILEHRVASFGEDILTKEDKAELMRLRKPEPVSLPKKAKQSEPEN